MLDGEKAPLLKETSRVMLGYIIYFLCMAFMGAVCWFGVK